MNNSSNLDFNKFIHNLSINDNVDLKSLIFEQKDEIKQKKKKKKKELIIEKNKKEKEKKLIKEDKDKCEYLLKNATNMNKYTNIFHFKTEQGKLEYKVKLLNQLWDEKPRKMEDILNLYFHCQNKSQDKIIQKIHKKLSDYEYKLFMLKEMGHLLPPLNFWDNKYKSLDDWQKKAIEYIKNKQSILIKAPTSSGKSFLAMACGILHKKILYICPTEEIVFQIGSRFQKMNLSVHYLVQDRSFTSFSHNTNIYIGDPKTIENNIYKIGIDYDYVVLDEIHNLDDKNIGQSYETIIKMIDSNFLALSATIKNIDQLQNWFQKLHPSKKINFIEYKKRFINHQKWIYGNKLHKIHPLSCITIDDINEDFVNLNLPFTPNDLAVFYETVEELFEDEDIVDEISPDNFFQDDSLFTLDMVKEYELFIKQKLIFYKNKDIQKVQKILDSFHTEIDYSDFSYDQLIHFFQTLKKKDMLPMLLFNSNETNAKELFFTLRDKIEKYESDNYPYHYDILQKKQEYYQKYTERLSSFSDSIKINTKDAYAEKTSKIESFKRDEKYKYIEMVNELYNSYIHGSKKKEMNKSIIKNLIKEKESFLKSPDFCRQDVFQKHSDFCFTKSDPMSSEKIREIKKQFSKNGYKINYDNTFFQMLKRGIGLYISDLPNEYKWLVQTLMTEKSLGIVITDKTLCMGIDLPIRSTCLLNYKDNSFSCSDFLQMSGRAGRRGLDNMGNIILYGKFENQYLKGELPDIYGLEVPNDNYDILCELDNSIHKENIQKIFFLPFNNHSKQIEFKNYKSLTRVEKRLLWIHRDYEKDILELISDIDKNEEIENIRLIIEYLNLDEKLIESYQLLKREENEVKSIQKMIELCESIHNYHSKKEIKEKMKIIHKKLSHIVFKDIFN